MTILAAPRGLACAPTDGSSPAGAFRGYASPQAAFAYEGQTELIARRVLVAPGVVRGKGVATILKTTVTPSTSTVALKLDEEANLTVICSTVEIGQGARTVLAQLAADATGVPLHRVHVTYPDSAVTAWDQTTSSSRSTLMMGVAVERAGAKLRAANSPGTPARCSAYPPAR